MDALDVNFFSFHRIVVLHKLCTANMPFVHIFINNKKVLLPERKRHTARRVVSTPSVVLPGYPPPAGYPPHPDLAGGEGGYLTRVPWLGGVPWSGTPPRGRYPVSTPRGVPDQGTPQGGLPDQVPPPRRGEPDQGTPPWPGYPPHPDLAGGVPDWVPPRPGYPPPAGPRRETPPPAAPWHSGKCCKALWDMGTPPRCGQTNSETITFPSYYVRGP